MASSIRKNLAALVISLAFMVISLPALAVDVPQIDFTALKVVTDGIRVPVGLAIDADGYIYVTDQLKGGVIKFDKFGRKIMFFRTAGIPQRVAIDLSGNVIVSEGTFVAVYNNNGIEQRRLKTAGGANFSFSFANGVAVHPRTGEIYVGDSLLNVVRKFTAEGVATDVVFGSWIVSTPDPNDPTKTIETPQSIAVASELVISDEYNGSGERKSRVFVADTGSGRIAVFSDAGIYESNLCGADPKYFCHVSIPQSLALEYAGTPQQLSRVYVVDTYQSTVVAIDPNTAMLDPKTYGAQLRRIGNYGWKPGQLMVPSGVVFDSANKRIVVANGYGNLTFYPLVGGHNPTEENSVLPIFTVDSIPSNVSEPAVTVSGTRGADVRLAVSVNTAAAPGATVYASGSWSCVVSGLVEGRNDITVKASNSAGVIQSRMMSIYYTKSMSSGFVIDEWPRATDQTSYVFTGKLPIGGTISSPSGCTYTAIPGNTTQRSWSCNVALANEGTNNIGFTVSGTTTTATIDRDTLSPEVVVFAIPEGASTSTQVQNLTGTVSDPYLKEVTLRVNGGDPQTLAVTTGILGFVAPKGVFSVPIVLNAVGANTIVIEATDTFLHKNTVTRTMTLDMGAPVVSVTSPADGEVIRATSVTVTGEVVPSGAVCKVDGVAAPGTPWVGTVAGNFTAGEFNNIIIECTYGGKTSKVKRTIFHGPSTLELAITDPGQDKATKATTVVVNGKVDPLTQILKKTINGITSEVTINANKTFTVPVDLSAGGIIPLTLSALDGVGNAAATSIRTFIADTSAPWLSIDYAATTPALIAGTVEAGTTLSLKRVDPLKLLSPTITRVGTGFTVAPGLDEQGLEYNLYLLELTATDQAGNTRAISIGKPDGDCDADTFFAQDDASICLNYLVGNATPTAIKKAHCDVGPLVDNKVSPNGEIDISDCILTLRRANGLEQPKWW